MSFKKTVTFSLSITLTLSTLAQEKPNKIVELDAIKIQHKEESSTEVTLDKLLKVPGAGNDPLRAIASLPGVTFAGGDTTAPAVRGSSPEDNRYLIDFMPVGYIFHTDNSSVLNDNALKDFMLDSAAFESKYHDATGAIIAANTRDPYLDQPQTILDLSVLKASVFLERQINERQAVYLSARQSLFQFYIENFLDDEEFEFTIVPEYYDYQGKYQYTISDQEKISVNILGARDKAGILFDEDSDEVKQDPGLSGGLKFSAYFDSQGIVWEKYNDNGGSRITSLSRLSQVFDFSVGSNIDLDIVSTGYSLRNQWSRIINPEHELLWGFDYTLKNIAFDGTFDGPPCDEFRVDCRLIDGTETITAKDNLNINNYDVNLADNWAVSHLWTLTPGVSIAYDDYTTQTFIEPKLQSRLELSDGWAFTSAYGKYHKLPDNFGSYTEEFGNRDLKQTEATHYELGLENQFNESLFWKLEAYYKMMDKLIISRPSSSHYPELNSVQYEALPRYTNDAEGHAWGFEFFTNKTLSDNWYGWLSIAYSETKRKNNLTGEDFKYNYDQPWIINLVSNYQINPVWQLGFKWRYQSGQLITPLISANQNAENPELYDPVYGELNSERLPASHSLDIRADRTFHYPAWEMDLYIEVLNVYNQRNITGYSYSEADYSEKEKEVGLPMMPSFGIKAKF